MKKIILITTAVSIVTVSALSFCGFYVAKADAKLFNKTSQIILVRDGNKTSVTMSSDFNGDVKDFAMVVPVPEVLQRENIKIAKAELFKKLDEYSGPRLVEYYDQNPCNYYDYDGVYFDAVEEVSVRSVANNLSVKRSKELGVKIEAQYDVDEYDILILSAKNSSGLKTWLTENGYKIPSQAEEVLDPYIKNDLKFFVVKVDLEKLDEINGTKNVKKYIKDPAMNQTRELRPIQITYNSNKFMLPIRLGMANASGEQDMIVYAFTKEGRVECTNYRTMKIPTDKNVPLFVRDKFGKFYVDLFDKAYMKENKEVVFLEYAWNVSPQFSGVKCDPCVGPAPIFTDLMEAGVDWAIDKNNQASNNVFFTRLHVRYSRETHPQDLLFHVTPNKEHFQARYILTNPAQGDLSCDDGQKYIAQLVKNRANELEQLKELTSWNTSQYSAYVQEYYDQLKDKSLLNEVDEQRNEFYPVTPTDNNDPNRGIKLIVIASVLSLMAGIFIRKRKVLAS